MNANDLEEQLRAWMHRRKPKAARLAQLEARICRDCREQMTHRDQNREVDRRPPLRIGRGSLLYVFAAGSLAGVAATLLVMAGWRHSRGGFGTVGSLLRSESGAFARQMPGLARVFDETERVFGPSLQWVAQSGRHAEVGMSELPVEPEQAMVVRLTLLARCRDSGAAWTRLWQTDVVTRSGGSFDIRPDDDADNRVALWFHRLNGDAVLLESRVGLQTPVRFSSESSAVLRFGVSHGVARHSDAHYDYLLIETVAPTEGQPCSS